MNQRLPPSNPTNIVLVGGPPSQTLRQKLVAVGEPWGDDEDAAAPGPFPPVFAPLLQEDEDHVAIVVKTDVLIQLTQVVPTPGDDPVVQLCPQPDGSLATIDVGAIDNMKDLLLKTDLHPEGAPTVMWICGREGQGLRGVVMDSNFNLLRVLLPSTVLVGNTPLAAGAILTLKKYCVTEQVSNSSHPVRPLLIIADYEAVTSGVTADIQGFSSGERAFAFSRVVLDIVMDLGDMATSTNHTPHPDLPGAIPPVKTVAATGGVSGAVPSDYLQRYALRLVFGYGMVSFRFTNEGGSILCTPHCALRNPSSEDALDARRYPTGCDCFRLRRLSTCVGITFPPELVTGIGGVVGNDRNSSCNYSSWYGRHFPRDPRTGGSCLLLDNAITDHVEYNRNQGN